MPRLVRCSKMSPSKERSFLFEEEKFAEMNFAPETYEDPKECENMVESIMKSLRTNEDRVTKLAFDFSKNVVIEN